MKTLHEVAFFVRMPTAEWQAAPPLVPTTGSKAKLRMAVDLRPINAATVKHSWPIPYLESETNELAGSTVFAILDFVSAYCQLPFHEDSWTKCGVVTPKGVMDSKWVSPGLANTKGYFQSTVGLLFAELRSNMKDWRDDFKLHEKDEMALLQVLQSFFEICKANG